MANTLIVGFDRTKTMGGIYTGRFTPNGNIGPISSKTVYRVIRVATRTEWEAQGNKAHNEDRVSKAHFYEIEALD